jgi:hypothetical protein
MFQRFQSIITCLWTCGKAVHGSKEHMAEEEVHFVVAENQRERQEGSGPQNPLQDHIPKDLHPSTKPIS